MRYIVDTCTMALFETTASALGSASDSVLISEALSGFTQSMRNGQIKRCQIQSQSRRFKKGLIDVYFTILASWKSEHKSELNTAIFSHWPYFGAVLRNWAFWNLNTTSQTLNPEHKISCKPAVFVKWCNWVVDHNHTTVYEHQGVTLVYWCNTVQVSHRCTTPIQCNTVVHVDRCTSVTLVYRCNTGVQHPYQREFNPFSWLSAVWHRCTGITLVYRCNTGVQV